jgi:hypothetical protein
MQAIIPVTGTPQALKGTIEQGTLDQAGARPSAAPRVAVPAAAPPPAANAAAPTAPIVNPALRFDLRLGLVVIEFFDDRGEVSTSIPTPRQLKAYESGLNVRSGPMPLPSDLPARVDQDGLAVVA